MKKRRDRSAPEKLDDSRLREALDSGSDSGQERSVPLADRASEPEVAPRLPPTPPPWRTITDPPRV